MQLIIGFNGPPHSGKDSIAACLRGILDAESDLPSYLDHLARPMREQGMILLGLDHTDFGLYNRIKDVPQELFNGATLRQHMIWTSENSLKPRYGRDFWGRVMMQRHRWMTAEPKLPGILLVPDIGFADEVRVLDLHARTVIVQLYRKDTSFAKDSRVYCRGNEEPVVVTNNDSILDATEKVLSQLRHGYGITF